MELVINVEMLNGKGEMNGLYEFFGTALLSLVYSDEARIMGTIHWAVQGLFVNTGNKVTIGMELRNSCIFGFIWLS